MEVRSLFKQKPIFKKLAQIQTEWRQYAYNSIGECTEESSWVNQNINVLC